VPLETRNASSYLLAFDNTNSAALGVALANISTQAANIPVVVRDDSGAQIASGSVPMPGAATARSSCPACSPLLRGSAHRRIRYTGRRTDQRVGVRTTPPGTLTSVPALANVGTGGGTFAHIAGRERMEDQLRFSKCRCHCGASPYQLL